MSSCSHGFSTILKATITLAWFVLQSKYVPRHLVRRRDALSQAVPVMISSGIDEWVSRSGCLMCMVGPPFVATYIFAHAVAAIYGHAHLAQGGVETFGHACVHVIFSIPHCAAPATVLCQSRTLADICIDQTICNPICGVSLHIKMTH